MSIPSHPSSSPSSRRPEGPVYLITGARRGIGRYLAEYYSSKARIVIGCSRERSDFSASNYRHFQVDVADEAAVGEMFHAIKGEYGRLDVLINNAGIAAMNSALLTPGAQVRRIFDTNVLGTFLCCREAGKIMSRQSRGRIVNFTTVAVPLKLEGEAAYVASKSGIVGLTQVLARELAPFGVTVNAVGPTPIDTDLIRSVPKSKIESLVARQAIRRLGSFEDVANVLDFFIRVESDFVTGQVLYLGGV